MRYKTSKSVDVDYQLLRTFWNGGSGSSDHIVEMVPPIGTLGNNFVTSNLAERNQGVFKLMGKF